MNSDPSGASDIFGGSHLLIEHADDGLRDSEIAGGQENDHTVAGLPRVCSFRYCATLSTPALVRVSAAKTMLRSNRNAAGNRSSRAPLPGRSS